jgi:hypothetical protein
MAGEKRREYFGGTFWRETVMTSSKPHGQEPMGIDQDLGREGDKVRWAAANGERAGLEQGHGKGHVDMSQ